MMLRCKRCGQTPSDTNEVTRRRIGGCYETLICQNCINSWTEFTFNNEKLEALNKSRKETEIALYTNKNDSLIVKSCINELFDYDKHIFEIAKDFVENP